MLSHAKGELFPYLTLLVLHFHVHLGLIEHCMWHHGHEPHFVYSGSGGCMESKVCNDEQSKSMVKK
jgi:hypothetical protein